jgi:hypothetical protein
MYNEGMKTGMDPKEVAEKVFAAVKEDRFYIYSHPEWIGAAQLRAEEIDQERNPTSMVVDILIGKIDMDAL